MPSAHRVLLAVVLAALVVAVHGASASPSAGANTPRGAGTGALRLGNDYARAGGYERYSYVLVGPSDARRVAALPGMALVYRSAMDLDTTCRSSDWCPTGVSYGEARETNPAWILRDATGREIASPGYGWNRLADVGDRGYQERWAANVARFLAANGAKGVFIDNVLAQVDWWSGGRYPAKYATNSAWEEAMADFVAYVGPALRARGFYVLASAFKYGGGRGNSDSTLDWWQRIGPRVNGLMSEHWLQNPNRVDQVYNEDPTSWTGHWSGWMRLVTAAQAMGREFFGIQYGTPSDVPTMRYGRASFLLAWNGRGGAYFFHVQGGADPWNLEWAMDVGTPLGPRYRVGTAWRRDFTAGTVLLNPSPSVAQTVRVGAGHALPDGTPVTSVTLQPTSALVLRSRAARPAVRAATAASRSQPARWTFE